MKKRILGVLLCLVMLCSMLPIGQVAYAATFNEYSLKLSDCTAYDADGNPISNGAAVTAGQTITIKANDAPKKKSFGYFVLYNYDADITADIEAQNTGFDKTKTETSFVIPGNMAQSSLRIEARYVVTNAIGSINVEVPQPVIGQVQDSREGKITWPYTGAILDMVSWTPSSSFFGVGTYDVTVRVFADDTHAINYNRDNFGNEVKPTVTINGIEATITNCSLEYVMATVSLTAKSASEMPTYSVTLNTDGGTIVAGKEVTSYTQGCKTFLPTITDITKAGYTFEGWYPNEYYVTDQKVTYISPLSTGNKTYYANWVEGTFVNNVNVSVTAPAAGGTPDFTASTDSTICTLDGVSWLDGSLALNAYNVFKAGKTYRAVVWLNPKEGYKITEDTEVFINGNKATFSNKDGNAAQFCYDFKLPDRVNVSVTAPVAGETPDFTASTDSTICTLDGVSWLDGSLALNAYNVFKAGKTYRAVVWLNPKEGYKITEDTEVFINGNKATFSNKDGNAAQFCYYFVATDAPTPSEYNITVTNGTASVGAGSAITKAEPGTVVTITADAPAEGKVFDKWVVNSGAVTLKDSTSATTTFTMPADDVQITATYKNADVVVDQVSLTIKDKSERTTIADLKPTAYTPNDKIKYGTFTCHYD